MQGIKFQEAHCCGRGCWLCMALACISLHAAIQRSISLPVPCFRQLFAYPSAPWHPVHTHQLCLPSHDIPSRPSPCIRRGCDPGPAADPVRHAPIGRAVHCKGQEARRGPGPRPGPRDRPREGPGAGPREGPREGSVGAAAACGAKPAEDRQLHERCCQRSVGGGVSLVWGWDIDGV